VLAKTDKKYKYKYQNKNNHSTLLAFHESFVYNSISNSPKVPRKLEMSSCLSSSYKK
jgi:hypothetical protein